MKIKNRVIIPLAAVLAAGAVFFLAQPLFTQQGETVSERAMGDDIAEGMEVAYFGGGCFWCVEAVYERLDGVVSAVSGYAGGSKENPTYEEVSRGTTGHAEVVRIEYDPKVVSYSELLDMFWKSHDPTTLNRQGADVGTQYRSIILYQDDEQMRLAEKSKSGASKDFKDPIVTEIVPLKAFYTAEKYHQDFYENNPNYGYCRIVIAPKLKKLDLFDQ
jgi:peptide-methionine (S)-S-oxide reductase